MARFRLLLLPGDGIGPEVMAETARVIAWFADRRGIDFDIAEDLVGGAAYDVHGTPLADATMAAAQAADAVLLGAVGGPKYDRLDFSVKPERGLLRLRKEMDLYANLRPAQCFDALADFSSLKRELVAGLDLMIVRELTSGIYFGEPRGIRTEGNRAGRHQHPALYRGRDRPRRPLRLRAWPGSATTGSVRWKRPM
jgi:3-isopropylmalate dehydrogenase